MDRRIRELFLTHAEVSFFGNCHSEADSRWTDESGCCCGRCDLARDDDRLAHGAREE